MIFYFDYCYLFEYELKSFSESYVDKIKFQDVVSYTTHEISTTQYLLKIASVKIKC